MIILVFKGNTSTVIIRIFTVHVNGLDIIMHLLENITVIWHASDNRGN